MASKHRLKGYIALAAIAAIVLAASFFFPQIKSAFTPSILREFLLGLGAWSYLVFFVLLMLSIPLPIPSTPIVIAGGYLFGTLMGSLISLLAAVAGASISFFLARKFGKEYLLKMIHIRHLRHFLHVFRRRGTPGAFISYAIPVFPSDAISLMLGFLGIKFSTFLLVATLGNIPRYLLLNALGEDLQRGFSPLLTAIIVLAGIAFILITLFREKVKRLLFKEIRGLERDARGLEKGVEKEARMLEKEVEQEARILGKEVGQEARMLERGAEQKIRMLEKEILREEKALKRDAEQEAHWLKKLFR